jgi:hypothetical protein
MKFAVIYTSFAVMGYKALHGVTYFFRLSCGNIADIFLWERAVFAGLDSSRERC